MLHFGTANSNWKTKSIRAIRECDTLRKRQNLTNYSGNMLKHCGISNRVLDLATTEVNH